MLTKIKSNSKIIKIIILLTVLVTIAIPSSTLADSEPRRIRIIEVSYTLHEWQLLNWSDESMVCTIYLDHEGEPTLDDIYDQCGRRIYNRWIGSKPCEQAGSSDPSSCRGLYLMFVRTIDAVKELEIELPTPKVWTSIQDCRPSDDTGLCTEIPKLLISAEEPLPNEIIEKIHGSIDGIPYQCLGDTCELPLRETDEYGIFIEFRADSSFGDSTKQYRGRVRVVRPTYADDEWRVDIISNFGDINTMSGCAHVWESFPSLGTSPDWLANPQDPKLLETDQPYTYLAGQLIFQGYVDTSDCDYYGLLPNGYASQCGLERSRTAVKLWQNAFDEYIIQVSRESGIPSQLFKRIFARESQFWPATTEHLYQEFGPGHINELGADTTLFWNKDFYNQFCPLLLSSEACALGYSQLDDWSQVLLRGAFLSAQIIDLPEKDQPIDPEQALASVSLFAETILGNCSQVKQLILNETGKIAGDIVSYEDLWRFTLVNYHGGSGCLAEAIIEVNSNDEQMTWENLANALDVICPLVVDYVNDIVY